MSDQRHEPETSRAEWAENEQPDGAAVDDDLADALDDEERMPFGTDQQDEQDEQDDDRTVIFEEDL